jgi:hypothetical protein
MKEKEEVEEKTRKIKKKQEDQGKRAKSRR